MDQDVGKVVKLHHAALLAAGAGDGRDQLGFEIVLAARGVVLQRYDLGDLIAGEADHARFLIEVGVLARENFDRLRVDLVIAYRIIPRFVVPTAPQFGRDFSRSGDVPHRHRFRRRENFGGIGEDPRTQFLVDQPRVFGVIKGEDSEPQDDAQREGNQYDASAPSDNEPGQARPPGNTEPHFPLRLSWLGLGHYI